MATISILSWFLWDGSREPFVHETHLVTAEHLAVLASRFTDLEEWAGESDDYLTTNLILDDEDGEITFDDPSALHLFAAMWHDGSHAEAARDLRAYVADRLGIAPAILIGAAA
jgi:hypothetical protein